MFNIIYNIFSLNNSEIFTVKFNILNLMIVELLKILLQSPQLIVNFSIYSISKDLIIFFTCSPSMFLVQVFFLI